MTDHGSADERDRINADDARDTAEKWRVKDAAALAGAQGTRQRAEGLRANAEQKRDSDDQLRTLVEDVRQLRSELRASTELRTATEDARIASAEQRKLLGEMHAAAQAVARGIAASRGD